MKKIFMLLSVLCLFILTGCKDEIEDNFDDIESFRLSSISDVTDETGSRIYYVKAPYTDEYDFSFEDASKVVISRKDEVVAEGTNSFSANLEEGKVYQLSVQTSSVESKFELDVKAKNNLVTLPYDVAPAVDTSEISLYNDGADPLVAATVDYVKRQGGTYIYSNNPELIPADSVGTAFIKTENLTGEVFFTFEHANYSGTSLYLGYQLKNEGTEDVYVTVTNVGYQAGGTWFGQLAWYDFFNTSFNLPEDYFTGNSISSKYAGYDYAYQKYNPRIYQPTTYRLPAGESFFVIGGTSKQSYNNINVGDTANKPLLGNKCANGNVKFDVTGGAVTATFYAYNKSSQLENTEQVGYRKGKYFAQYLGTANHSGVIDNFMTWTFNDQTPSRHLPISYTNYYDDNVPTVTKKAYQAYNSTPHFVENTNSWMSHLNPQNDHQAVGMDIVEFTCIDEDGKEVVIDNHHSDGGGRKANTANWMIEYQDHFTFVNQGDKERTVKLGLDDGGTLAILLRDSRTGEVIDTYYTIGQAVNGQSYTKSITIPPHSVVQISLCYVLVACSYGNVTHNVQLI